MAATQQSSLSNSFLPDANTIKSLSSGAFAGAVSRTITSPLERLKVMKQVQASGTKYGGIVQALQHMYREEGLKSYWKGNGTNVARIAPFSAIQFFAFDAYKRKLFPEGETTPLRTLFAGALTGATASTICYPLDLVRSCLSVQTTNKQYNGIVHALVTIVKKEGPLGLYRGLMPTLLGIAPYIAINMTTFDLLRNHFMPSRDHEYATIINLLLGATAGGTAATITYPTDVVRRRIQLQGMDVEGLNLPKYSSTSDCVRQMIAQEGVAGLYKGLGPCLLKVVPSMAIAFMLYEGLRKHLKFDPPKNKAPSAG